MTPEALLAQFDVMVEAPNGLQKLRELILQLAVRGKLVRQDPSDEPASMLLHRIADERTRLARAGEIRKMKKLALSEPDERPFELPVGWAWAPLGVVTPYPLTDGDWVESKDQDPSGDVRLVQLADVGEGDYRDRSSRFLTSATAARLNCTFLEVDDILIARLPSPIGRACVFPGDRKPSITVVDVAIARCGKRGLTPRYLMHAINSLTIREQMLAFGTGTTRFRISTSNISRVLCPIPPLPEQRRIVAKLDELMSLCDDLESRLAYAREKSSHLAASIVHQVGAA